jgi:hypothetical protein
VALRPNAGLPFHVVLPSIALRSRKNAVPHFPHQAGHHRSTREEAAHVHCGIGSKQAAEKPDF